MRTSGHNTHHSGHRPPHHGSSHRHSNEAREPGQVTKSTSSQGDGSSVFVEDRKGDRRNLEYASLDRYAIPRYHASGGGALIGLGPNYRIISKSDTRREVQNVELDSTRKSRKQSLLSGVAIEDGPLIKPPISSGDDDDLRKDFLNLRDGRARKRRRISTEAERSISEGSSDESDHEIKPDGDHYEDPFDAFKKDPVQQRHLEFSRATMERPEDVKTWLALINYQDVSFGGRQDDQTAHTASSRSLSELRISLYEQALSHVNDQEGRHTLILGLMQEGSKVWDVQKQASQWQSFLDKQSSFELWVLYLNFMQSNALKFNLETCLAIYTRCLQKFQSRTDDLTSESGCIYLLLRLTLLLWQAGFTERAVGVWQAMLEYNIFRPERLLPADLMPSFEQFWASEVARVGEEGATGWGSNASAEPEPTADKEHSPVALLDFGSWEAAETGLGRHAVLPARALDEVSDDDPYRILLFSDIKEFVFSIASKQGLTLLQDAFLLFLGLPPCSSLPEVRKWRGDPFIYSQALATSKFPSLDATQNEPLGIGEALHDVHLGIAGVLSSPDSLSGSCVRLVHLCIPFVRRAVSQLADVTLRSEPNEMMMEYDVALEAGIDPKSARKRAKLFLKRKPDSLKLYNIYALLECKLGNFETAEKVWSTALSMRGELGSQGQRDASILWRDWSYSYMILKDFHKARNLLSMITNANIELGHLQADASPSVALQIKIEQYIKSEYESSRLAGRHELLPVWADILAIHRYLNSGLRLDVAVEAYEGFLHDVTNIANKNPMVVETIHENRARLLYAHSGIFGRLFRPKECYQLLAESVRMFPLNVHLLSLHHFFSQKAGLMDRLRQLESTTIGQTPLVKSDSSIIRCVFSLLIELRRPSYAGSTVHSNRAAFKRATERGSPGIHCVDIWKKYILWEISLLDDQPQPKPSKDGLQRDRRPQRDRLLTETLYAALRACPWSKDLYMIAFRERLLREAIGGEQLRHLYESMTERGLRIRLDISDWKSNDSKAGSAFALHTAEKTHFAVELNPSPCAVKTRAMTSTFATQLRTIAANANNELDLRARRDAHAESLIFDRPVAAKQDWDTIYQICVDGFQELCLLDSRLREFEQNLYSPQAKDQDREQLSKTQNETLGVVVERCLALLGSKVVLRPGVRAVEWLIRRFRVHVYNTSALLATFLPYHETLVFRSVLSIIPANKVVNEWKFLGPYHKIAANVPRHAVVYSATNNDAFFSYLNNYTLRACQEGAGHPHLLRFWGSLVIEAVTGRLNQVRSGRKEVEKQRLEDALLKIFPLLVEGFEIRDCPDVSVTCFTTALLLASNSTLEDSTIDSLMRAVAPHVTDTGSDPKSALACVIILAARKAEPKVPKVVLDTFIKMIGLKERLLELKGQVPVDTLVERLITSSLAGLKRSNLNARIIFIERLFDMSPEVVDPTIISSLVAIVLRKLKATTDDTTRQQLVPLLQKLNDNVAFSPVFSQAVQLAGQSLTEVEAVIEGTIETTSGLGSIESDRMELEGPRPEALPESEKLDSMLASLPSKSVDLSFLTTRTSSLFEQLSQAFALSRSSEEAIARFQTLSLWGNAQEQPSDLQRSFLLRIACSAVPVSQQATALQILSEGFEKRPQEPSQLLLPYLTVLLADPAQAVRRATVACVLALRKRFSESSKEDASASKGTDVYDGLTMTNVKSLPPSQSVKLLDQVFLPTLEECILDASHIRTALESAFDSPSRSSSSGAKATNVELKKSLKHDLFELLTSCAVGSPLLKVKLRIIELLVGVQKVGSTSTGKALAPVLKHWSSLKEDEAHALATSDGLSLSHVDAVMVQIIDGQSKDAVEQILEMVNEASSHMRSDLVGALFDRLLLIWKDLRHESQFLVGALLFHTAFSDISSLASGSRNVLQSVALSTEIFSSFLELSYASVAELQIDAPPRKKRRTSHGRDSLPRELVMALNTMDSRLTFTLELLENSRPENHPQLMGDLFEALVTLTRTADSNVTASPYLVTLCLSSLLAIVDKARQARKPDIDISKIRADLVIDCARSSENPQVQSTALLLAASLASLVPDRILHTIMPIFTFMGHNLFAKEDERSIYVTNHAIDQIIPPLVTTLKKQDANNLVHSTSSLLSSFVTAFDHIPPHRRVAFYQRLLDRLGAEDFAFAVIAKLASRRRQQDTSAFFSNLLDAMPAATQISTQRKILGLVNDVFSATPHNAEPLLDITKTSKKEQREQEAEVLLETSAKMIASKGLKAQVRRMGRSAESVSDAFWAQYRNCLTQLLSMLKDQKVHHPTLTSSTRKCLSALLELPSLAELLHVMPNLLQEMGQVDDKELQPLALRVLATQLRHNAPKDSKTQSEAMALLPTIETVIESTQDEAFRHAAIACLDRIIEVYGRKSPEAIMSASNVLIDSEYGLNSQDSRTQVMSLLCLASAMEVLKEAAVPIVPQSMSKVLSLLASSVANDVRNAELHNAAFTLLSSFLSHVSFMVSDENVSEILEVCRKSCAAKLEVTCKESRLETLRLVANKIDLNTVTASLNQVWNDTSPDLEVETVTEYLDLLSQAIKRCTKSTVVRNAESISTFMLQVLDLRRQAVSANGQHSVSPEDITAIELQLQLLAIPFIYKLNDTTFRPLFETWVEWAIKPTDLSDADFSHAAKTARASSVFGFVNHFFATLKSIATSYAGYILGPANDILRSTISSSNAALAEHDVALYKSTLTLLRTVMEHDADGFFASPSHFSPLSELLVSQLTLSSVKSKALRASIPELVIPAIVALATSTMDTPSHHHAINHNLCQLRHNESAGVRLSGIRTHLALTQDETVGEEWVNNVVVGASTEGVGGSGETMIYVNESLEDDDEEVEQEVRRWVQVVREMVGEDVFEV
nr:snoRNA-binding rRNA-processing protein utp10 [Exophiala xenobiotica]